MDIIGKNVKLWVNEREAADGTKFNTYSVSASRKDADGNYVYAPIKVFFKRDIDLSNVESGMKFDFKGFDTVDVYTNKDGKEIRNPAIMIMQADFGEFNETAFREAEEDMPF